VSEEVRRPGPGWPVCLWGDGMNLPVVRVLIAEDFPQWRQKLGIILKTNPALRIVGEAENGLDAIQRISELNPDLVLLDVGLPILNGIEVAKAISRSDQHPKIIFVSENRSWEIAEEAFRAGGLGYIPKSQVGSELLPAVDAVLGGKKFVSGSLRPDSSVVHVHREQQLDFNEDATLQGITHHEVAFYEDDSDLESGFAQYAESAISAHKAVLLITSEPHRTNIERRLRARGVDLEDLIATGTYGQVDAADALSEVMVNGSPDLLRCREIFDALMRNISTLENGRHREVAICGECAPRLLMEGKEEAALELERHWDRITRAQSADTLCGYWLDAFPHGRDSPLFQRICAEHTAVHKTGRLSLRFS